LEFGSHPQLLEFFKSGEVVGLDEISSLAHFFASAESYDILHICGSINSVFFSRLTETPVLLSLDPGHIRNLATFRAHQNDRTFIVWTAHPNVSDIPNALGVIPDSSDSFVEDYLLVYQKILSACHREDHRPWGYYRVLSDLEDHKVKRIVVYPGKRLSLQSHRRRSEHWIFIGGAGLVTLDSEEIFVEAGQSIFIPVGVKHRIKNPGSEPTVFIEVQTGDYFGEDDIERFEDDFGRK
ncbi:MAG: phosphomannose isomerase type II C-terminal cupin domain, partial [Desulfomonilaceae bacterium]